LLKAERSASNYRYYGRQELDRLRLINEMKRNKYSLEDIKRFFGQENIALPGKNQSEINQLKVKMQKINKDLQELATLIEKNEELKEAVTLNKNISHESLTLIQSLLLLLL
jgi:MerR family transcriptional regulator, copper efflux regulator